MTLGGSARDAFMCLPGPIASSVAEVGDTGDDSVRFIESAILPLLTPSHTSTVSLTDLVLSSSKGKTDMPPPPTPISKPASTSSSPHPRRSSGLRKNAVKIPCDDCIQRASQGGNNASIQLCDDCMRLLHRPRKRATPQPANVGRIRRHSDAIIDTALGLHLTPVSVPWSEDRELQHALQFFVRHSAPQLAGYFDSPFWQRMLLQSGRHSPAVKHAIAAIGTLHERLLIGADDQDVTSQRKTRFALEQCNQSIQHLTKPTDGTTTPDLRLMLTTCVLFTCFEAMQGHCEQAIAHARQGYTLLRQYATDPESDKSETCTFAVELSQLCLIMQRLQTQSKGLMAKNYTTLGEDGLCDIPKPVHFEHLGEARIALEKAINYISIYFLDLDLSDNFYDLVCANGDKFITFAPWLKAWEEAFTKFLVRSQDALTPTERKGAMVLKAHHLVCEILSDVDLSEGELGWDKFHSSFVAILDLAEAVLEDGSQPKGQQATDLPTTPKTQLCFSLGIVDPLYEVCTRCRDPALRRRALDLLARHPRQDCMWSSWSAYKVGKYLMNLEEERSSSPPLVAGDISAEDRISEAWFDFSKFAASGDGSTGRLMYKRMNTHHSPREALNPGLFATEPCEQQAGQEVDFAQAMLGSNFLDAELTAATHPTIPMPLGFELGLEFESRSPPI